MLRRGFEVPWSCRKVKCVMKKPVRALLIYVAFIVFFLYEGLVFSEVRFYSFEGPEQEEVKEEYEIRFYSPEESEQEDDIGKYDKSDQKDKEKDEKKGKKDSEDNTVIFPNGGEILLIGNGYDIKWNFEESIEGVSLYFSTDRGLTWEIIAEDITNDGSFLWIVPPITSVDCMVKVRHSEKLEPSDASDRVFSISASDRKMLEEFKMLEQNEVKEHDRILEQEKMQEQDKIQERDWGEH